MDIEVCNKAQLGIAKQKLAVMYMWFSTIYLCYILIIPGPKQRYRKAIQNKYIKKKNFNWAYKRAKRKCSNGRKPINYK